MTFTKTYAMSGMEKGASLVGSVLGPALAVLGVSFWLMSYAATHAWQIDASQMGYFWQSVGEYPYFVQAIWPALTSFWQTSALTLVMLVLGLGGAYLTFSDFKRRKWVRGAFRLALSMLAVAFVIFAMSSSVVLAASPTSGPVGQSVDTGYGTSCSASFCIFTNTVSSTKYYYAMVGLGYSSGSSCALTAGCQVGQIAYGGPGNAGGATGTNAAPVWNDTIAKLAGQTGVIDIADGYYIGSSTLTVPANTTLTLQGSGEPIIYPDVTTTPPKGGTQYFLNTGGVGGTCLTVQDSPGTVIFNTSTHPHQSGTLIIKDMGFAVDALGNPSSIQACLDLTHSRQVELENVVVYQNATNLSNIDFNALPQYAVGISKNQGLSNTIVYKDVMVVGFGTCLHFSSDHTSIYNTILYRCAYGISLNWLATGVTATGDAGITAISTSIEQVGIGVMDRAIVAIHHNTGVFLQSPPKTPIPTFIGTDWESITYENINNYDGTAVYLINTIDNSANGGSSFYNDPVNSLNTTFAAPSVPTSGAGWVNNYPFTVQVKVSGGTVSEISINSFNTGETSGLFTVLPGDDLTITYTAAPTWTMRVPLSSP